jgi:penicillin-binding protein 1C
MSKKISVLIFLIIFFGLLGWVFYDMPSPKKLSSGNLAVSTKIFDRNGKLIYEIYADQRRTPVEIDKLPPYVKNATIAIEDREFYKHHGFSLTGIARAFYKTIFKHKVEGGSTLTQQLVKNSLLTPERTLKRKIKEFVLATLVEIMYPKDKILEMYLNQIPYGSTAYGIQSASELYFGKEAKDLTLAEAALLAGLPAAPTAYSPFGANPERAKIRQEMVLKRMVEDGYISQDEADRAKNEELKYAKAKKLKAAHFTLWVKELLAEKYGDSVVEQGGLRVTTTLDLDLQEFAEEKVASEVAKLKKQNVGNGAALVTRPKSGEILAMVGSKDYFAEDEDGKFNVIFSLRQPGSSIKPLNYALGIENKKITASTPLADIRTCFIIQGQAPYCPKNYDNTFHGIQQVRFALGNSLNIPAVRVLALNGIENFIDFANKMGITTFKDPSKYGLSLTLGGGEVRPYDMAIAFGVFANQGIKVNLNPILKVEDWKGKVYEEVKPDEVEGERVLSAETAFIISNILSDNGARSMAFGSTSFLNVKGHPEVSVKTGTTNDRRDNWTIGYTTHILALSWVGNNNNEEMSGAVSGVSGASPIWNEIIKYALDKAEKGEYNKNDKGHGIPSKPEGVVGTNICNDSGNKAVDDNGNTLPCPSRFEYFLKEKVGAGIDMGQKDIGIDKTTGALADKKTPPENIETQNKLILIDPLGTAYCFDCIATQSATISYPLPKTKEN